MEGCDGCVDDANFTFDVAGAEFTCAEALDQLRWNGLSECSEIAELVQELNLVDDAATADAMEALALEHCAASCGSCSIANEPSGCVDDANFTFDVAGAEFTCAEAWDQPSEVEWRLLRAWQGLLPDSEDVLANLGAAGTPRGNLEPPPTPPTPPMPPTPPPAPPLEVENGTAHIFANSSPEHLKGALETYDVSTIILHNDISLCSLAGSLPRVDRPLHVTGECSSGTCTVDGCNRTAFIYYARGSLQMRNLTLQNFYSNDSGGVIYAEGGISINITNCVLKNNRARVGAVMYITGTGYAYGPTYVSVTNSVLQDNFGSAAGRAPQNTGGGLLYSGENNIHVLFEQCSLQGNSAESFGGITNLENCTNGGCSVTFHQCDISENSANRESGGVVNIGMCSGGVCSGYCPPCVVQFSGSRVRSAHSSLHGALVAVTLGDDAKAEVAILDNSEIMDSRSVYSPASPAPSPPNPFTHLEPCSSQMLAQRLAER
ncbi:hypothetical protein CYMTET_36192, partial [Cymbomonas tetramitiformis]